jgi:hypothetical protein
MPNINFKSPIVWAVAGVALWWFMRKPCDCNK